MFQFVLLCLTVAAVKTSLQIQVEGGAVPDNKEASLIEAGRQGWRPACRPPLPTTPLPTAAREALLWFESQGSSWKHILKPLN